MHIYIIYIYDYDIKEFCIYPKSSSPHPPIPHNSQRSATISVVQGCPPRKDVPLYPIGVYGKKSLVITEYKFNASRTTHMTGFKPGVTKVTDQPLASCIPGMLYIQLTQLGGNIWLLSTEEAGTSKLSWIALNMIEHINHSFLLVIHIIPYPPTVIFITHRGPRNLDLALDLFMFGGHMGSISS